MSVLYYDATQLVHWPGKLTGIPRVMHELAIRFHKRDPRVCFVVWAKELQQFCEIDLGRTLAQRGKGIVYLKIGEELHNETNIALSTSTPVASYTSEAAVLKQGAIKVVKASLRKSAKITPRLAQAAENYIKVTRMKRFKKIEFQPGDVLLIPWGEWWDPNFIKMLEIWQSKNGVEIVPIIHDMGPIFQPQYSGHSTESLKEYCRRILPVSKLILAVSKNTRHDIEIWLNNEKLKVPRIEVFREGDDFAFSQAIRPDNKAFNTSGLKGEDYILCVGTIEAKKNHTLLYYVYKLAKARQIQLPKLIIVGRRGWKTDNIYEIISEDPEIKDDFIFMHDTDDAQLSWLYDHCLFTVFPSFYEGWGIPIAESIARGVPCICSNTSSMVEIAEGYVEHFTPFSTDECLTVFEQLLIPDNLKAARAKVERYKQTSWNESFRQVSRYLEDL